MPSGLHPRRVAMPRDTDVSGAIFGAWILPQIKLAGGTFAVQHAQCRVATVSIKAMRLLRPIDVVNEVSCHCTLARAGDTSVAVKIGNWVRDRSSTEKVKEGVFTYMAPDDNGDPRAIANPLTPSGRIILFFGQIQHERRSSQRPCQTTLPPSL